MSVASPGNKPGVEDLVQSESLARYISFQSRYGTKYLVRPDVTEGELVRVTDWRLLTPEDYDRTSFHIELDVRGTSMEHYPMGKALSVYATNDLDRVRQFLAKVGLDPHAIVAIDDIAPPPEDNAVVLTTVERLFVQYLDIFGKPSREFLKKLFPLARDILEKVKIAELTLDRNIEEFQDRAARGYTFADYLEEFTSARPPVEKYLELIPTVKQRVYSICSSSDFRPGFIQLLVVREDWDTKDKQKRAGLCSNFLSLLRTGACCLGHLTHSVMEMPHDKKAPIFMAGLGTGLAPFRAFIEQRKFERDSGAEVGPLYLFFGGRYSAAEYYYREEMEGYERESLVACHNAWSRDSAQKVYVQHKIMEQRSTIWEHLGQDGSRGYFFLCGSKQPEKDVQNALLEIFQKEGRLSETDAQAKLESLKNAGRYVTEVY